MDSNINNDTITNLIRSNPEVEDVLQYMMDDFNQTTSVFVHELRNPLTVMKSTIQYIEMKHPETKEYKYWEQLQGLVMDIENMMADASTLNICNYIKKEDCNLLGLLNEVVNNFMPQAVSQQKELKLIISSDSESYYTSCPCDGAKIKQVFSNLIKNAMEATVSGDYIHVILEYISGEESVPPKLCIKVCNNGAPIPEDEINTIFKPYISYKKGGTGIGLAVVKRIVSLHYGTVSVTSSEDETCFSVLLPI